ncbi:MAG: hypothetical protein NZM00_13780 [Anaerolinea sp.]|nr:hypothetical protein [Anaerolinea sp.]
MPHVITPLVDGHLVLVTTWGILTSEELQQYDQAICALFDKAARSEVHVLYDWSRLDAMPSLADIRAIRQVTHPKRGWAVFVSVRQALIRFVLALASQLFNYRIRFFDTYAAALAFLNSVDPTLPLTEALIERIPAHPALVARSDDGVG